MFTPVFVTVLVTIRTVTNTGVNISPLELQELLQKQE
jgi:hypothetical protein